MNEIIEDWNFLDIFDEYTNYAKYPNPDFAAFAIRSIGTIATKSAKHGHKCIKYLVGKITAKNSFVSAKSMVALADYLGNVNFFSLFKNKDDN